MANGESPRSGPDQTDVSDLDTGVPHIARMQNYWRGGTDNFEADRLAAEHAMAAYPDLAASVLANRAFLARSVRYLVREARVRQFLDLGTGLPTAGGVHEVAQRPVPQCRVVYVDNDRCKWNSVHRADIRLTVFAARLTRGEASLLRGNYA